MLVATAYVHRPYISRQPGKLPMTAPHHTDSIDWAQFGGWIAAGLTTLGLTAQNMPKISKWIVKKLDTETEKQARKEIAAIKLKREERDEVVELLREQCEKLELRFEKMDAEYSQFRQKIFELFFVAGTNSERAGLFLERLFLQSREGNSDDKS